jgi:hypothetical protein
MVGLVLVMVVAGVMLWMKRKNPEVGGGPAGANYFMTGSDYKGNYVFGGAMQLAINDLNDKILKGKLQLDLAPTDKETARTLQIFNMGEFTVHDLDEPSYYVKSGYGQDTVSTINKESRAKFPTKSFADLDLNLGPKDFIAYAYFLKQIEYYTAFEKRTMQFMGQNVKGFGSGSEKQDENVQIVEYKNDDNFTVKLKLKDDKDEIYLAKGYDMTNPNTVLQLINSRPKTETIDKEDVFDAPEIHFELTKNYTGFLNKTLKNPGFTDYYIKMMTERIKFDMDNKGARVENEAFVVGMLGAVIPQNNKHLILNKPYWIIMKRTNSNNAYFVLGVKNTGIMQEVK